MSGIHLDFQLTMAQLDSNRQAPSMLKMILTTWYLGQKFNFYQAYHSRQRSHIFTLVRILMQMLAAT
jgi:hypothetical protein